LIHNGLKPAGVEELMLCEMLGRASVLVKEDQLSLAIGRRGQNVRLASKLSGWDIEIMTQDELRESIERAVTGYCEIEGIDAPLSEKLVGEGFLSYDDLSIIEPDALMEMGGLTLEQFNSIVAMAETRAEEMEKAAAAERRRRRLSRREAGSTTRGRRRSSAGNALRRHGAAVPCRDKTRKWAGETIKSF
ncbi:MAG: hypothetical protein IIA63_12070, partial [Nitrospinae bacterium]|nr:hypothetical protein [Nitrospinota bacterium]